MNECKENVLEMIEESLSANRAESFCTCQYSHDATGYCNYCKINHGLQAARNCIISSVIEAEKMRGGMIVVQAAIESKIKRLLEV